MLQSARVPRRSRETQQERDSKNYRIFPRTVSSAFLARIGWQFWRKRGERMSLEKTRSEYREGTVFEINENIPAWTAICGCLVATKYICTASRYLLFSIQFKHSREWGAACIPTLMSASAGFQLFSRPLTRAVRIIDGVFQLLIRVPISAGR